MLSDIETGEPSHDAVGDTAGVLEFSTEARGAELADLAAGIDALTAFETPAPTATGTSTPPPTTTPTAVAQAPAAVATDTPELPTATLVPPTETPLPPTPTPEPPAPTTPAPTPTAEPPTATPEPPTATPTLALPSDVPLLGEFVPTATPTSTAIATSTPTVTRTPSQGPDPDSGSDGFVAAKVTRYADSLEGNSMACGGEFDQDNPYIVAVSLAYDTVWPCGTPLEVCGTAGCLEGMRTDTCPGCPGADIDMTRAGVEAVCGNQTGCDVVIRAQEQGTGP